MSWIKISIASTSEQAELLADLLTGLDALAVSMVDAGSEELFQLLPDQSPLWQKTWVQALYPADQDANAIINSLQLMLGTTELNHQIETIEEQDWVRQTQMSFQPIYFEDKLAIYPSWTPVTQPHIPHLLIDPGLAFGTGTHPTTQLCLDYLAHYPPINKTVIDYGCGSGILALAALVLGAKEAWGTDLDPQALTATHNNAALNPTISDKLNLCLPNDLPSSLTAELVLANILANPLLELADTLLSLVKPGGTLVLSGLLTTELHRLMLRYQAYFEQIATKSQHGWARMILLKKII